MSKVNKNNKVNTEVTKEVTKEVIKEEVKEEVKEVEPKPEDKSIDEEQKAEEVKEDEKEEVKEDVKEEVKEVPPVVDENKVEEKKEEGKEKQYIIPAHKEEENVEITENPYAKDAMKEEGGNEKKYIIPEHSEEENVEIKENPYAQAANEKEVKEEEVKQQNYFKDSIPPVAEEEVKQQNYFKDSIPPVVEEGIEEVKEENKGEKPLLSEEELKELYSALHSKQAFSDELFDKLAQNAEILPEEIRHDLISYNRLDDILNPDAYKAVNRKWDELMDGVEDAEEEKLDEEGVKHLKELWENGAEEIKQNVEEAGNEESLETLLADVGKLKTEVKEEVPQEKKKNLPLDADAIMKELEEEEKLLQQERAAKENANNNIIQNEEPAEDKKDEALDPEKEMLKNILRQDAAAPDDDKASKFVSDYYKYKFTKEKLLQDFEKVKRELMNTDRQKGRKFGEEGTGSESYRNMANALQTVIKTLKGENCTPGIVVKALEEYEAKANDYYNAHKSAVRFSGEGRTRRNVAVDAPKLVKRAVTIFNDARRKLSVNDYTYVNTKNETKDFVRATDKILLAKVRSLNKNSVFAKPSDEVLSNSHKNLVAQAEQQNKLFDAISKVNRSEITIDYKPINENYTIKDAEILQTKDYALNYLTKKYIAKSFDENLSGEDIRQIRKTQIESGLLKKEADKLAKDKVFAHIVKKGGRYYDKWKEVEKNTATLKDEYTKLLDHYKSTGSYTDHIVVEGTGLEDAFSNEEKARRYETLSKITAMQILLDNKEMLEGVAAGTKKEDELINKAANIFKREKIFDEDRFDLETFKKNLNNGTYKKHVIEGLKNELKPVQPNNHPKKESVIKK